VTDLAARIWTYLQDKEGAPLLRKEIIVMDVMWYDVVIIWNLGTFSLSMLMAMPWP